MLTAHWLHLAALQWYVRWMRHLRILQQRVDTGMHAGPAQDHAIEHRLPTRTAPDDIVQLSAALGVGGDLTRVVGRHCKDLVRAQDARAQPVDLRVHRPLQRLGCHLLIWLVLCEDLQRPGIAEDRMSCLLLSTANADCKGHCSVVGACTVPAYNNTAGQTLSAPHPVVAVLKLKFGQRALWQAQLRERLPPKAALRVPASNPSVSLGIHALRAQVQEMVGGAGMCCTWKAILWMHSATLVSRNCPVG